MKTIAGMVAVLMLAACGGSEDDDCALTQRVDFAGHDGTGQSTCIDYFRDGVPFAHCDVTATDPGIWTCSDAAGSALASGALSACSVVGREP